MCIRGIIVFSTLSLHGYTYVHGESTFQSGTETIIVQQPLFSEPSLQEMIRIEVTNDAATSSWDVFVEFDAKADSRASASVSFDGSSGSECRVYTAPEDLGITLIEE